MKVPGKTMGAAVDRMSRALERLSAAPPVVAVLEELLCQASSALGASGAFLCWWGGTGDLSTLTTQGVDAEAAAVCAQRLLAQAPGPGEPRLPRVVEDVSRDALLASEPDARRELGAGALLSQPLFFAGGLGAAGVLGVLFREAWRPAEGDLQRFGLSVKLAALALERERMAETLRQSVLSARAEVEETEVLRLRRFQAVTEAFGRALSWDEVARVVLEQGLPAVGASLGMVHLVVPDGTVALKAAVGLSDAQKQALHVPPWRGGAAGSGAEGASVPRVHGGAPGSNEGVAGTAMRPDAVPGPASYRVPPWGGGGTSGADAGGISAPLWLETPAAVRDALPGLVSLLAPEPPRALVLLPLHVEGRTFGTLCFGFSEARRFSALERASITGLGHECGQALERARLYARERTARLQAEAAGQRLRLLADASALVSASLDWEETVAGVARLALGHFADGCAVDSYEDGVVRRLAVLYENPHTAPRGLELLRFTPQEGSPTLLAEVLASGRPWMMARPTSEPGDTRTAAARLYAAARELGVGSLILTPLVARQRTLGVLTFMRGAGSVPFDIPDLSLAEELAGRAALAIDNADLFRKARAAEEESRRGAARLHVLVQVSHLIAEAGLDLPTVLEVLVRKVSEALGDACVLQLLSEDKAHLDLVSVHHPDAEARAVLDASMRRCPARVGEGLSGRVAATGQPLFVPRLQAEDLRDERVPQGMPFLQRYGPHSVIVVPLGVRGRVLGTLGVMREARGREYSVEERALLESLAARAALAIEDARRYGAATQAVKARDEMLSVAGHELKSPLNALQLQIHLLARMAREAMAVDGLAERAERAAKAGQRLGLLIDDLLDVSRLSSGRLGLKREEVDLAALTRELVGRMSEELALAGSEVRLVLDEPVSGQWDRLRLEQVLVNLLSNAAKYGAGRPVTVEVGAVGPVARLSVRDEGIGVSPDEQERIFEQFERSASVQHFKGLGLGLWITKRIIEAHGGSIRLTSEPGKGSTFTVELPLPA
ncbi:GAF domain-containing protein [Corallococcus macrosporus]|uniref:histidine kinase n=1 Tax=Myxococcus fulvus (strain ATCC BAA-855 / HW-1) TaxID=483219 RepID=F8CIC7_MYXFH|nr:GAF domain-containing protein [Corallococcus macrosporus]AEI63786.1 sensor histidine kinase [Corallococcus macrosporus]